MTTIAYRDGMVAADSRACRGQVIFSDRVTKLRRLRDGRVAAVTGEVARFAAFADWLDQPPARRQSADRPPLDDDTTVIVFATDWIEVHEVTGSFRLAAAPFAVGSGMMAARAAMAAGATAERAVAIAIEIDPGSGGPVQTATVEPPGRSDDVHRAPCHIELFRGEAAS